MQAMWVWFTLGEGKVMGTQCDLKLRSTCWNLDLCTSTAAGLSLCAKKLNSNREVSPSSVLVLRKGLATHSGNCPVNASLFAVLLFPVLHQWLEFRYLKLVLQQSEELNRAYIWTVQPIFLTHGQNYLFFQENNSFWLGTSLHFVLF